MMESEPVLVGSVVTWQVSQPSLPHAEKFIRRRIEWANERFSATVPEDRGDPQPSPDSGQRTSERPKQSNGSWIATANEPDGWVPPRCARARQRPHRAPAR